MLRGGVRTGHQRHVRRGRPDGERRPVLGERIEGNGRVEPVAQHERTGEGKGENDFNARPVMWKSGANAKIADPGARPVQAIITSALVARLACVVVAPLGTPLVPEV